MAEGVRERILGATYAYVARCGMGKTTVEDAAKAAKLSRQMLLSKIVPNCKKLVLLDAGDGWLRKRFGELGVIQFEDLADTGEECEMFQLANGETAGA